MRHIIFLLWIVCASICESNASSSSSSSEAIIVDCSTWDRTNPDVRIKEENGILIVEGLTDKTLSLRNIPPLLGIVIKAKGVVSVQDKLILVKGGVFQVEKCVFHKGIEIHDKSGRLELKGGSYIFREHSTIPFIQGACNTLDCLPKAHIDLNKGILQIGLLKNARGSTFAATELHLKIDEAVMNEGNFHITQLSLMQGSKEFSHKSGVLAIQGVMNGSVDRLYINGPVEAHCMHVFAKSVAQITKNGSFNVGKFLYIHSDDLLSFAGKVVTNPSASTAKDALKNMSPTAQQLIHQIESGIYFSAKNRLGHHGLVRATSGSVHFQSHNEFSDLSGFTQHGVFKEDKITVVAKTANLFGKMIVDAQAIIQAQDATLAGIREGDGDLLVKAFNTLIQKASDSNALETLILDGKQVHVGGKNNIDGREVIRADEELILEDTHSSIVHSQQIQGKTILDKSGSKTSAKTSIRRSAQKELTTQKGSQTSASTTINTSEGDMTIGGVSHSKTQAHFQAKKHLSFQKAAQTQAKDLTTDSETIDYEEASFRVSGRRHHKTVKSQRVTKEITAGSTMLESTQGDIDVASKISSKDSTLLKGVNVVVEKTGTVHSDKATSLDAKKTASIKGSMTAKDHKIKAGEAVVVNGGTIDSEISLLVDTLWYFNKNFGHVKAKRGEINADRMAGTFFARQYGNITTNTLFNASLFSHFSGRSQVNTLVDTELFCVSYGTRTRVNLLSLINFNLEVPQIPTFDNGVASFCKSLAKDVGRSTFNYITGKMDKVGIALQLIWTLKDLDDGFSKLFSSPLIGKDSWRPSYIMKKMAEADTVHTQTISAFKKAVKLCPDYSSPIQKKETKDPDDTKENEEKESPKSAESSEGDENAEGAKEENSAEEGPSSKPSTPGDLGNNPVEDPIDPMALLWDCASVLKDQTWSALKTKLLPTSSSSSLFGFYGPHSLYITNNRLQKSLFLDDRSTVIADSHSITTFMGSRTGTDFTNSTHIYALGNFTIGGIQDIDKYVVDINGNLTIDESLQAKVGRACLTSRDGDIDYAGHITSSSDIKVEAKNGHAVQREGSTLHSKKETIFKGANSTTVEEETSIRSDESLVFIGSKTGRTEAAGSMHGAKGVSIEGKGLALKKTISVGTDEGAPIFLHNAKGGEATIEKGASFNSSVIIENEEESDFELPPPPTDVLKEAGKKPTPKEWFDDTFNQAKKQIRKEFKRAKRQKHGGKKRKKKNQDESNDSQASSADETATGTDLSDPEEEHPETPAEPVLPKGYVQFTSEGKEDKVDVQGTFNTNNLCIKSEGPLTLSEGLKGQVSERADIVALNGLTSEEGATIASPLTVVDITGPSDNKMTIKGPEGSSDKSVTVVHSKEGLPTLGMKIETTDFWLKTDTRPFFTHQFSSAAKNVKLEIPDLAQQAPKIMMKKSELGELFKEADNLRLVTSGHTDFTKSQHSAFRTFALETDTYTVHEKVKLSCDEGIILYANVGDAVFKAGSKIVGGVYYDIGAPKGYVIREHKLHTEYWDTDHTKGEVKKTQLDSVTFKGGVGIPYIYEDPKTGEFFVRYMGGRVVAGKEITGTAGGFDAIGDVIIKGKQGIVNNGLSVIILDYDKDPRWDRTKRTYEYDTVFYETGIRSRGGRIILESEEGFLIQDAGSIQAADGIDNYTKGDIQFRAMIGKKGKVTDRNAHWGTGIFQKADEEKWSEIPDVTREWVLQGPVRHHSQEGRIRFVGSQILAPNSKVHIYSKEDPIFESIVLNDYYRREGWQFTTFAPSTLKDLTPNIQSSLSSLGSFADGNIMQGAGALLPSAGISFGYGCQETYGQHLQTGFIVAGSWDGGENGTIHMLNGFQVKILGACHENANWNISGAKLHFSSSNSFLGFKAGVQGFSPYVGAEASTSKAWGHHYQSGGLEIGGILTGKNSFNLDQSNVKIKTLDGELPVINARTRQNKTTSMHFSAALNYHVLSQQASVSVAGGYNTTRKNAQQAGVEIGHATKNAKIGGGHLIGADVTVDSQEEGAEIGTFTKEKLPEEGTKGVTVALTFALTKSDAEPDSRKLIDTIGTATINGYEIPLITGIHLDNILNLPNQLISDVGNASRNIAGVFYGAGTSYPVIEETLLPIDKFNETPYGMPDIIEEPIIELKYTERTYEPLPSYFSTEFNAKLLADGILPTFNQTFNEAFGITHISPLQKLWSPRTFNREGTLYNFGYKIRGTGIYLESPAVFNNVQAARYSLATSTSEYAGGVWRVLQDKTKPIYVFNRETLPYGREHLGTYFPLSGQVTVAGAQEKWPFTLTLAHEKQHHNIHQMTGDPALGYVPNNAHATHCNRAKILEQYAEDARQMGFKNFSRLPQNLSNSTEAGDMFIAPWYYFKNSFCKNLDIRGISLSKSEINCILLIAEDSMFKGVSPSSAFVNNPNYKPNDVHLALLDAEREMLCEIPTFATEVDLNPNQPGRVKIIAPKTHKNMMQMKTNASSGKPIPEPLFPKRVELSEWETFTFDPTIQNASRIAHKAAPVLILGANIYEQYAEGEQISDAFARGTIKTGFDIVTFGVTYGGIARTIGPYPALFLGAADVMINIVPEFDVETAKRLDNAYWQNPHLFNYGIPSAEWRFYDSLKNISPGHWCGAATSWIMNKIDDHIPCVPSAIGQIFKFVGNGFEEYCRVSHEIQEVMLYDIRNTPVHELPVIEVKTPDIWWDDARERQKTADNMRLNRKGRSGQEPYEYH